MAGLLFHCTGIATLFHQIVTIGAPAESFKIRFGFITGARGLDSRDNHGDDAGTRVNVNSNANATHSCIVYLESTQLFDVGGLTLDKCVLVSRGCKGEGEKEKSSSIFYRLIWQSPYLVFPSVIESEVDRALLEIWLNSLFHFLRN